MFSGSKGASNLTNSQEAIRHYLDDTLQIGLEGTSIRVMAHGNFDSDNDMTTCTGNKCNTAQEIVEDYPNLINYKGAVTASASAYLAVFIVGAKDSATSALTGSGVYTVNPSTAAVATTRTSNDASKKLFPQYRCATQKFDSENRTMCTSYNGTVGVPADCVEGLPTGRKSGAANAQDGIAPIKRIQRLFSLGRRSFLADYSSTGSMMNGYEAYDACTDGCCCNSTTNQVQVKTGSSAMTGSC